MSIAEPSPTEISGAMMVQEEVDEEFQDSCGSCSGGGDSSCINGSVSSSSSSSRSSSTTSYFFEVFAQALGPHKADYFSIITGLAWTHARTNNAYPDTASLAPRDLPQLSQSSSSPSSFPSVPIPSDTTTTTTDVRTTTTTTTAAASAVAAAASAPAAALSALEAAFEACGGTGHEREFFASLWSFVVCHGLQLDSQTLPPPNLYPVSGWIGGRTFSLEEDPDRTREPWVAPDFVHTIDPCQRAYLTRCEDIVLPPPYHSDPTRDGVGGNQGKSGGGGKKKNPAYLPTITRQRRRPSFAKIVHGILEPKECAELLESINSKGFTPALLNVGRGLQLLAPEARDGFRAIVDSPELAKWLLQALGQHLPGQLESPAIRLRSVNERCRVLCYTPGQSFPVHCDGRYQRPPGHVHAGDCSRVTIQLYLHTVPQAHGGATTLFPGTKNAHACHPVAGSALIFTQDLPHEGSMLERGLKYTLRTEAMYTQM